MPMLSGAEIRRFVTVAAAMLARERDLAAFEVYCSSSEQIVARLNHTSEIPSRGVEEVKSLAADGFALRIVTRRDRHETGSAFVAGDLSIAGVKRALGQALNSTVIDPHFPGLPISPGPATPSSSNRAELLKTSHLAIARAAWETLGGAMREFARRAPRELLNPGLIIGGDFTLTRERITLAGSGIPAVRTDQDAWFTASVTVIIEAMQAKATSSAIGRSTVELQRCQSTLGRDAIRRALDSHRPASPPSGRYSVVLGPQPLGEILSYLVIPSLSAGAFYRGDSAYYGRFGSQVMDRRISLIEDPGLRRGAIRRRVTCEGLPAGPTVLIRDGKLTGLLSNFYDSHRLAGDAAVTAKLGEAAPANPSFAPLAGYRIGDQGGRRFDSAPHSSASNVIMKIRDGRGEAELHKAVRNGIYVGRVWYTYPINGQRAGDFTCTVSGDSYLIENGRLTAPIAPNSLRISAHIDDVFGAAAAVGNRLLPSFVWGQPEVFYLPAIAIDELPLTSTTDTPGGG
jgi:PmbA protein